MVVTQFIRRQNKFIFAAVSENYLGGYVSFISHLHFLALHISFQTGSSKVAIKHQRKKSMLSFSLMYSQVFNAKN